MDWNELQIFLAVARVGQLLGAGRQLGLDRTTVSRRLSALEARLGTPLFERSRAGLRLTRAGARAAEHAARMDVEARGLVAETTPLDDVTGVVRLAVTEAIAPFLVEQGLLGLSEAHPALRLELLSGNQRLDLGTGQADLALRVDPLRGATLRARCLARSPVTLYASAAYLARHGRPRTPAQLRGHLALLPGGELGHLPEGRWLASRPGIVPAFASNSLPALVAAARMGCGIVALTATWGARESALVRLFELPGIPPRAMWLVSTRESARRPACVVVTRKLVEIFGRATRPAS